MGDHGALGAAGGAAGVEEAGEIIAVAGHRVMALIHPAGQRGQRCPRPAESRLTTEVTRCRSPSSRISRWRAGSQTMSFGLASADEIFGFGGGVGGVERMKDGAAFEGGEIEEHIAERFLDLDGDAVTGLDAKYRQGIGVADQRRGDRHRSAARRRSSTRRRARFCRSKMRVEQSEEISISHLWITFRSSSLSSDLQR